MLVGKCKVFRLILVTSAVVVVMPWLASAVTESDCAVGVDGSCEDSTSSSVTGINAADDDVNSEIIPAASWSGFIDVGYGVPQKATGKEKDLTILRLKQMKRYMRVQVFANPIYKDIRAECKNQHESCAFWAALGECEANPSYMTLQCAPSCFTCEKLSFDFRCPFPDDVEQQSIWNAGDLEKMFNRIVDDYADRVTIYSRPGQHIEAIGGARAPWVVTVDDFLTPQECETLIQLGAAQGYEQSRDVGARKFDGTYDSTESPGRTSTNAWCIEKCYQNDTTQEVLRKIEALTGIPDANSEYLQLLRYEKGQFYESHHDYIPHHLKRAQGPRILTVFLYLNDVQQGGGTRFTDLNITVIPRLGRALVWPSVKDSHPDEKDRTTHHEALPVIEGIKYGANAWLHQRDFKTPYKANCI